MTELTPKQESFCLTYIETGNASEAYRQTYEAEGMKPETINRKAKELLDNGKITARIEELKAEHAERHKLTVDDLLKELEEARELAKAKENPNAMTQATMGKAKILGLDKQIHEVKADLRGLPSKINIIFTDEPDPQITGSTQ
ncbi:terminase small subunit [Mannheimia pernigra]|uniref:terminase small subunit n=1 Tax=Mannheimia pernigra TaxID=111844 RepID=UPI001317D7F8|nr:terminase small subunit [Mannheimia pernigra]QHB17836.1 hypothetical protein GM695_07235 [Mannheimia pernigra]